MPIQSANIRSKIAAELIAQNLQALDHPAGVVRLTQFAHQSDGITKLKLQIAEALVFMLEQNGLHICNGLSEAVELLEANGYTVTSGKG